VKALEALSDGSLRTLAIATNVTSPARRLAPKAWEWFGDLVAFEIGRRHGMDVSEPSFPMDLSPEETEAASVVFGAMAAEVRDDAANGDRLLADVLQLVAEAWATMAALPMAAEGRGH